MKFTKFLKSSLLFNSFYCFTVYKQNFTTQQLRNLSSYECENFCVCYLCWDDHIYLLKYNLHDWMTDSNLQTENFPGTIFTAILKYHPSAIVIKKARSGSGVYFCQINFNAIYKEVKKLRVRKVRPKYWYSWWN